MIPVPVTLLSPPLPALPKYPMFDMELHVDDNLYPFIVHSGEDMDKIIMKNLNIATNRMVKGVQKLYRKRAIQHQASEWKDLAPATIARKKSLAKSGKIPRTNVSRTLRRGGDLSKAVNKFDIDVIGGKGQYFLAYNDAFNDVGYLWWHEFGEGRPSRPFFFEGLGNIQLHLNQAMWQYEEYLEKAFEEKILGGSDADMDLSSGVTPKAKRGLITLQDILAVAAPSEAVLALGVLGEVKAIVAGKEHFNASGIQAFIESWIKGSAVASKTVVRRRVRRTVR